MAKKKVNNLVFKNVKLGKNCQINEGAVIGVPPFGKKDGELSTVIGDNAVIREYTIIYAGVEIGDNFQTGPNVLIRENNKIGNNVVLWHRATLNPGNEIGNETRIHAGCFLEETKIGDWVFVGPNVTFTDDPHPVIPINFRDCWGGAKVGDHVTIGGGVTLLPNISIGEGAVIGAGSVVTKDIPSGKLAVGNPAKVTKNIEEIHCKRKNHYPYKK